MGLTPLLGRLFVRFLHVSGPLVGVEHRRVPEQLGLDFLLYPNPLARVI